MTLLQNQLSNFERLKHKSWLMPIAGAISALGFEPWGLWPLTLVCFALLSLIIIGANKKRQAFKFGWLFAIGHFCFGLQWIAVSFTYQGNMPSWIGYISVLLLSLYLAVYPALAAMGAWWITQKIRPNASGRYIAFTCAFAGFWILTEWLRSWMFTGFAWNPLSVVFVDWGILTPLPLMGTYAASGLVISIAAITMWIYQNLLARNWRDSLYWSGGALLLLIMCIGAGQIGAGTVKPQSDIMVTVVQPGISQEDRNNVMMADANVEKLIKHSGKAGGGRRLLLWPESAVPWYLEDGYPFRFYQFQPGEAAGASRAAIAHLLKKGDYLITGNDRLIIDDNGQLVGAHNSVMAMNSTGKILSWYNKAHLVPYGEYLALRWLLEPLGAERLVPGSIDFWPGPGPKTMSLANGMPNVGLQICYEIIFSGKVTEKGHRPDFIFNPSNDAWFGEIGPPQFLSQARMRAAEEGIPTIRSTPTGISAVIDARGQIITHLPLGKAGGFDAKLPPATSATLFAKWGNILPLGWAAILILAAIISVAHAHRRS